MSVASTSKQAYEEHILSGKLGMQATLIYHAMKPGVSYSRRELSSYIGIDLSSVCGRVNELLEMGLIEEGSKRKCIISGKLISPVIKDALF
jgi:DNA-binding MarR family transcriptional regulator